MALRLIGKKFGRLTVIGENPERTSGRNIRWDCICECGTTTTVSGGNLMKGSTSSCGCSITKHNMRSTAIYQTFVDMKSRCTNPKHKRFKNYGGRGISVCARWAESMPKGFLNFLEDMLPTYEEGLELDRKDNDSGYHKDNCRWVTRSQNNFNRGGKLNSSSKYKGVFWCNRTNRWISSITLHGKTKQLGAFIEEVSAANAYNIAAKSLFGEFAYLNRIDPF